MISTLVVFQQLDYIQNKELGYSKDQVLIIEDLSATKNQKFMKIKRPKKPVEIVKPKN